ncbi:MAG: ParA family protein [Marinoscillum sp.]
MIIAIVNQKGGTAKTTTTVNLGKALALRGKRVLLVDADPQGSLSYSLGVIQPEKTIADLLYNDAPFEEVMVSKEGMDIIPSDVSLADAELVLVDSENRETHLRELLAPISQYDVILIDCPPSLSLLTVNALTAADKVIVPMLMEVLSLQGLDLISETIDKIGNTLNEGLEVLGILPVMVDTRRKLSYEVFDHISQNYDFRIFETRIRPNVRASEAPSFGQSVVSYAPDSNSAKDYVELGDELLKLI